MNATPEMVRAEMDYRLERARVGARLAQARAARRPRQPWWQRVFGHVTDRSAARVNEARLAG